VTSTAAAPTRRNRQRQATLAEIVSVSRGLLSEPGGLSLRAVAQQMGMTAPALYRYVDDYRALVRLIARDIDAETAELVRRARDSQPEDDPVAQIICAAIAFRRWALHHPDEFALVFANPRNRAHDAPHEIVDEQTGEAFVELLGQIWLKYDFPLPSLDDLDPIVLEALEDPMMPGRGENVPAEARPLVWVCMQSWARLYGTVTLEVFGHCDPRVIQGGALFRAMLVGQGELLGISHELPRLRPLIDEWIAAEAPTH
jgi:AcrR family transcriptional regulator